MKGGEQREPVRRVEMGVGGKEAKEELVVVAHGVHKPNKTTTRPARKVASSGPVEPLPSSASDFRHTRHERKDRRDVSDAIRRAIIIERSVAQFSDTHNESDGGSGAEKTERHANDDCAVCFLCSQRPSG